MLGSPIEDKQFSQRVDHIVGPDPSCRPDRQALPGVFIDHGKHSNRTTVLSPAGHEVISPHMTFSLRFQPDA